VTALKSGKSEMTKQTTTKTLNYANILAFILKVKCVILPLMFRQSQNGRN